MQDFPYNFYKKNAFMNLSAPERLKAVVKWYSGLTKTTQKQIGESIGYPSEAVFSQFLNGHKEIPKALPGKIASLDPRINIDFLTGVSDEMLLPGNVQPDAGEYAKRPAKSVPPSGVYMPPELLQMFADLSSTVRDQQQLISSLINNITKQ